MKVSFVGSGNVATHLAQALFTAGYEIVQVYSRNIENANRLANTIGALPINDYLEIKQVDVLIVSITDDALAQIVPEITDKAVLIIHTSGTLPMSILEKSASQIGVLYPLQTFSITKEVNWLTIPICVETSSEEATCTLKKLAQAISNEVIYINSDQRKALHVAAVFACNFSNHLYHLSSNILEKNGLSFDLLKPLVAETAEKIKTLPPIQAQTGPALRGDEKTIATHLKFLENDPTLENIYLALTNSIKSHKK